MKKIFVSLFAALALSAPVALAEVDTDALFDSGDNHSYLGIRVSLESPLPSDIKMNHVKVDSYKNGVGINGGVVYHMPIWKNLYFEPGASLFYNAMGENVVTNGDLDESFSGSVRRFGIRVPVQLGYHFDVDPCRLYLYTGPVFELGLIGRSHTSIKTGDVEVTKGSNIYKKGGLNRGDVAWKIGVGVSVDRYYLGLSGNIGMCNFSRIENAEMHSNLFELTLGFNL